MSCVLVIIQTKLIFIFTVRAETTSKLFFENCSSRPFYLGGENRNQTQSICQLLPWPWHYPCPLQQQPSLRPLRWWWLYPVKGSRQSRSGHYIRVRSTHRHQPPRRPQGQLRPQPSSLHCGRFHRSLFKPCAVEDAGGGGGATAA